MFARPPWKRRGTPADAKIPRWAGAEGNDRPARVLVEQPDGAIAWAIERTLRRVGWDVAVCPGPHALTSERCPLLQERRCPAVEGSDAILFALPLDDEEHRSILRAHRETRASRPVCVETTQPEAERHHQELSDLTSLVEPISGRTVIDAFERTPPFTITRRADG